MTEQEHNDKVTLLEFLDSVDGYFKSLIESNEDLLAELLKYQRILVNGETSSIERETPKLDRIAGAIRAIDMERRNYVNRYFIQENWEGSRNFSTIAEHVMNAGVSDEEAHAFERVSKSRKQLIAILAEVDAQNSLNITLIGQGLTFAEAGLKALLGFDNTPPTYGPPSDTTEDGPSILDAQA